MWRKRLPANALGVLYMTFGSLGYVVNDGLIRMATEDGLGVYQALFLRGCAMIAIFAGWGIGTGRRVTPGRITRPLLIRVGSEVVGTALFFAAIIRLEFANAQTILMLVPFAVTVVAALRLGERVDTRRYALVTIGFIGVIAVVRPTPSQFSPWALLVVATAFTIVVREFATRRIDSETPALPIALLTAVAITTMMGTISIFTGWGAVGPRSLVILGLACLCLIVGYVFVIEAARVGDLSVSAPFRYTAVLGAVVVGIALFDEIPDALTTLGCILIIGAGVATARQEAGLAQPYSRR